MELRIRQFAEPRISVIFRLRTRRNASILHGHDRVGGVNHYKVMVYGSVTVELVAAAGLAVIAAVDTWTFLAIAHLPSPRPWRIVAVGLLTIGATLGMWLGCFFTRQVAPALRYVGFPIPALALQLEDGRWVDYVGLIPVVVPFNIFTVASCCLLPVSGGLLVRRLAAGSSAPSIRGRTPRRLGPVPPHAPLPGCSPRHAHPPRAVHGATYDGGDGGRGRRGLGCSCTSALMGLPSSRPGSRRRRV